MTRRLAALLAVTGILLPAAVFAQSQSGHSDWTVRKCALYTEAWSALAVTDQTPGISPEFLTRHSAFLASGCTMAAEVCPQSPAEFALADTLSLMAVAEGMAGSFLPFACP